MSLSPSVPAARLSPKGQSRGCTWALSLATAVCLGLIVHTFALSLLPRFRLEIPASKIRPYPGGKGFAYAFSFNASLPQTVLNPESRVRLYEEGKAYPANLTSVEEVRLIGGDRFSHQPGQIVFSAMDNSDPRTNGKHYVLSAPILYTAATQYGALIGFGVCLWLLYRGRGPAPLARAPDPGLHWRWHLWGATALLLLGLYLNTGALAPYAVTSLPIVDTQTGYAYNQDHEHFRVLFDFVDGRGRTVWDHALFLRRILFPVLAWPLMRYFGFELGGAVASLLFCAVALVGTLSYLRRRVGARGAILAGWLLALYPGAAYWAGLPYTYALIFPFSLLLTIGVAELVTASAVPLVLLSLALGVGYLGYDLAPFFLPASLLALAWRRRFGAALLSGALQALPSVAWLFVVTHLLDQPLENSNTSVYHRVLAAYVDPTAMHHWWDELRQLPTVGLGIFFGANFLFIPALALAVAALNARTSRIRLRVAEGSLLLVAFGLFLFLNAAPTYGGGWVMRGTWISRLYQPVFPTLVFLVARWWQELPRLDRLTGAVVGTLLALVSLGDALIVFGPILHDPGHVSEQAFYRFYNHTDRHESYEATLERLGRRPLGFPWVVVEPPHSSQLLAIEQRALADQEKTLASLQQALVANRRAYLDVARALAANRLGLAQDQLRLARARGQPGETPKALADYLPERARDLINRPELWGPAAGIALDPASPLPVNRLEVKKATVRVMAANAAATAAVLQAQAEVGSTQTELGATIATWTRVQQDLAKATAH